MLGTLNRISDTVPSRHGYESLGMKRSWFSQIAHACIGSPSTRRHYSVQQVWSTGIAQALLKGGMPRPQAIEAGRMLCSMTPEAIEVAFLKGRSHLIVLQVDGDWHVSGRLLSVLEEADELAEIRQQCRDEGKAFTVTGVDVEPMLTQLLKQLDFAQNAGSN